MFCPTCRCEFRPSFTRCASCDVDLVDDLAVPEKEGEAVAPNPVTQLPMVDICGYFDLAEARHARDLLHEHRIAGELAIRASPATPHDGAVVEEYWLRADVNHARQIPAILDGQPQSAPADETVGTFECSNCQRPVREEESFCANCGMRFSDA